MRLHDCLCHIPLRSYQIGKHTKAISLLAAFMLKPAKPVQQTFAECKQAERSEDGRRWLEKKLMSRLGKNNFEETVALSGSAALEQPRLPQCSTSRSVRSFSHDTAEETDPL